MVLLVLNCLEIIVVQAEPLQFQIFVPIINILSKLVLPSLIEPFSPSGICLRFDVPSQENMLILFRLLLAILMDRITHRVPLSVLEITEVVLHRIICSERRSISQPTLLLWPLSESIDRPQILRSDLCRELMCIVKVVVFLMLKHGKVVYGQPLILAEENAFPLLVHYMLPHSISLTVCIRAARPDVLDNVFFILLVKGSFFPLFVLL
mmetsp:Transcript_39021/g.37330  ORF Transcript_39021/g.37330 Transcript_39021/m.37330 type:complete len:208 (+) Transcript_39021:740-1363(+)